MYNVQVKVTLEHLQEDKYDTYNCMERFQIKYWTEWKQIAYERSLRFF